MRELPSDLIIERAVELWGRALENPIHDNGDKSLTGFMTRGLMNLQLESSRKKNPDLARKIDNFKRFLTEDLKFLRDNYLKPRPDADIEKDRAAGDNRPSEVYYFDSFLNVDYHPSGALKRAGEKAEIPEVMFSIKSSVFMGADHVSTSFGYGREDDNHYPLPDGRWLVTTLRGSEISKVIDYVMGGKPEFEIDITVE